ncbi:MAG: cyclase family protein [bacterium]|nr:cyclase family protein [bacterium]
MKPYSYTTQKGILNASMFIDISRPIHRDMAIYPENPSVRIDVVRDASATTSALSTISFGSHTGTHIDTSLHIDVSGTGAESYSLDQYIGDADVIEIDSAVANISADVIPETTAKRVLLKTKNSYGDIDVFDPDFAALMEDGAEELIRRGVRLVGIDGPSIKKKGVSDRVHELFLRNNIVVVEGLWLQKAIPGTYQLLCLPLLINHTDGVPVRAVLASAEEIDY